jgi:hypothetical protein
MVMYAERQFDEPISLDELRRRKMTLEQRLDDGFVRIGEAEVQGRDVSAWESFWLSLLDEYESVCDELDQAA